jgi:hypothetical protein
MKSKTDLVEGTIRKADSDLQAAKLCLSACEASGFAGFILFAPIKIYSFLLCPERATCNSPGHRPGYQNTFDQDLPPYDSKGKRRGFANRVGADLSCALH